LGNRPLVAIATAELAAALDRRGRDGDRERAAGLLDEAVGEADAMRLTGRAAAWRARRAALTGPTGGDGPGGRRPGRPPSARAARRGVIRREGRGWLVEVDEHRVFVRDLVGMGYLAQLVVQPGRLVSALSLASHGAVAGARSRQDVLDDEARAAYAARSRDLVEDLAEAEANNDLARAERLRAEIDALVEALDAATGLGGRSRTFTHDGERARTAVRKALRRAIDEIDAADGAIGQLLRSSVTTGATCVYAPVPGLTWSTAGDGGGDLDVDFDP
ncbi:MAG TPA: hypothetical protein VFI47_12740, partial [Acidimicrobiales bacterium]|nr:hypothetical protein [Acidimicrobiales bacterium]